MADGSHSKIRLRTMSNDKKTIMSVGQIEINPEARLTPPDYDDLPILAMRDIVLFPGVTFPVPK